DGKETVKSRVDGTLLSDPEAGLAGGLCGGADPVGRGAIRQWADPQPGERANRLIIRLKPGQGADLLADCRPLLAGDGGTPERPELYPPAAARRSERRRRRFRN